MARIELMAMLGIAASYLLLIALGGCTAVPLPPSACPAPVEYSAAFQRQLADEVERLPRDAALVRAMADYGEVRARLRACR